jgi:hypothetical protein
MGDLKGMVVFLGRKRKVQRGVSGERRESIDFFCFYEYNKSLGSYNVFQYIGKHCRNPVV